MEDFNVKQTLGTIECNFDEIREALAVQMSAYTGQTVTEDTIPDFKTQLATLRKIRTAVDDRRKTVKKNFMKPYDDFDTEVKKLLAEIDKPISEIDTQLKMFEEDRRIKKREHIQTLYSEAVGEYDKFLPLSKIYNPKWENVSYKDSDIKYDISEMLVKVKTDLSAIKSLNSEIEDSVIETYIRFNNDLSKAIERNSQYLADKQKVVEKAKEVQKEKPVEATPAMKQLSDMVEMVQTVKFTVSKADFEQVKELLEFSNIKYQIIGD